MAAVAQPVKAVLFLDNGDVQEVDMASNTILEDCSRYIGCEYMEFKRVMEWERDIRLEGKLVDNTDDDDTYDDDTDDDAEDTCVIDLSLTVWLAFNEDHHGERNPHCPFVFGHVLLYASADVGNHTKVLHYEELCGDMDSVHQLMCKVSTWGVLNDRIMRRCDASGSFVGVPRRLTRELRAAKAATENFFDNAKASMILDRLEACAREACTPSS